MKKSFFYIHLNAVNLFTIEDTIIIDSIPVDPIFIANGFWAIKTLDNKYATKLGLLFKEVDSFELGENLLNSKNCEHYPNRLFSLNIEGKAMKDDLGLYQEKYLIASQEGIEFLKSFGLNNFKYDFINGTLDEYFETNKHFFWMPEKHRKVFIDKFTN